MANPSVVPYLTPQELSALLDLVGKVNLPINVTIVQLAPILQRAMALASLPAGTKIVGYDGVATYNPATQQVDPPVPVGTVTTDPVE